MAEKEEAWKILKDLSQLHRSPKQLLRRRLSSTNAKGQCLGSVKMSVGHAEGSRKLVSTSPHCAGVGFQIAAAFVSALLLW